MGEALTALLMKQSVQWKSYRKVCKKVYKKVYNWLQFLFSHISRHVSLYRVTLPFKVVRRLENGE
jgi:hypothetical protein